MVSYFPPSPENYMDLPYYTEAAMLGALAGYGAKFNSMIEPTINNVTNNMVSALIGALTVTAGKLIFDWIPRIQPDSVTALQMGNGNGGRGSEGVIRGNRGGNTLPTEAPIIIGEQHWGKTSKSWDWSDGSCDEYVDAGEGDE